MSYAGTEVCGRPFIFQRNPLVADNPHRHNDVDKSPLPRLLTVHDPDCTSPREVPLPHT